MPNPTSRKTRELTDQQKARIVERFLGDERYSYPAGSRVEPYTVIVSAADGKISCDCMGWTRKKAGQSRRCKHTDDAIAKYRWNYDIRGDYYYRV